MSTIKQTEEKTKTFTFSKEELQTLQDIEIAMISFKQAVSGMLINKQVTLMTAYKRMGIDGDAPDGMERNISFNLGKNEVIVTDTPKIILATK